MIRRLLIANRGEIAVRVTRACRELGISPLAVYSDADRDSLHVRLADSAMRIGPSAPTDSYLNMDAILAAATALGADAVHPGYGFLSENAEFAQRCADAFLVYVGPTASAIRLLGDKSAARQAMAAAGVPIVPGYDGIDQGDSTFLREAKRLGFPVLIKSAMGGGGRGMRLVNRASELKPMLSAARSEALASFGNGRLLLERFIQRPHHVEIQVLADSSGDTIHLFERECSIQRRNQKIVEESPSPLMTTELRCAMAESAIRVARTAGYVNAGTVEFLVDASAGQASQFYFLEMNTRIQVEHPVTEAVTGLDLVRLQIEIAGGAGLDISHANIAARGHAIEVRICAEDPEGGFIPSAGAIRRWIEPTGPGIRVDAGYSEGDTVWPQYDSLLAKVIAYGTTREAARMRLAGALEGFCILGVRTNISYLLDIVRNWKFITGDTPTSFLVDNFTAWSEPTDVPPEVLVAAAAERITRAQAEPRKSQDASPASVGGAHWRNV